MKIKKMSDEECLSTFLELLEKRVRLDTAFVRDPDGDNITHQVIQISCGDFVTVSQPQPLEVVLRPATGEEIGVTVN